MDYSTRRAALRAAAKVALSASIIGCGSVVVEDLDHGGAASSGGGSGPIATATSTSSASGSVSSTGTGDIAPDAGPSDGGEELACDTPPLGVDAGISDETLTCCIGFLGGYVPDGSDWPEFDAVAAADPSVKGCCNAMIQDVAKVAQQGSALAWNELNACCGVLGNPNGPACTPWGPPVPPEMPIDRALLEVA
jgi:hypothetical protein